MLNEDGLLLILVLAACGLVVLGTLELLWPTRPRHPRRQSAMARDLSRRPSSRAVSPRQVARPAPTARPTPSPDVPTPAAATLEVEPRAEALSPLGSTAPAPRAPTPAASDAVEEVPPEVDAAPVEPEEPELPVVERGYALLKEQRLGEVVTLAERALRAMKSTDASAPAAGAAQDAARLWGLMGLAKQGLDDFEGARFAFEEAIAGASGSERQTWEGHLVALTLAVGRRALARARTAPPADRVTSLTSAVEWLERGLAISPNDGELRDVVTAARDTLWGAHEAVVNDLLQRRALTEARRMLEDVIADPECPPERRLAFCRLLDGVNADAPRPDPR
jgi:hypothetical protein